YSQGEYVGIGFRAGLTSSRLNGPLEQDVNGLDAEQYKSGIGFHIGLLVNFKFTDLVGVRTELMYSQRGTKQLYEGESYFIAGLHQQQSQILNGHRNQALTVTNSYLDIPLLPYYKFGALEIFG